MRRRRIEIRLVKDTPSDQSADNAVPPNFPETQIIEVMKEGCKYAACLIATAKVVDVMSKTTMHIVKTKIK